MILARLRHPRFDADIAPLAASAGEVLLGGMRHDAWQAQEAEAAGLSIVDVEPGAPLPEGCRALCTRATVFSRETLAALLNATPTGVTQAAIRAGTPLAEAASRVRPVSGDVPVPLFGGSLGGRTARVVGDAVGVDGDVSVRAICDEEAAQATPVRPHGRPPHRLLLPDVVRLGGTLLHWLDVLELSLAALQLQRRRLGLAQKNRIGDADIHPSAYVAGSVVEDGVRIEAHASVIGCFVGRDCHIADHTVVVDSVLGANTRTLVDTSLRRIVAQGDSTLSNLSLSDVVLGTGVFVTTAVSFFGPDPGTDAVVDGMDTRRPVLGGAIGARAILGARALLAAGVAIPAGALVVARPDEAASKLDDEGLARAAMVRGQRDVDV